MDLVYNIVVDLFWNFEEVKVFIVYGGFVFLEVMVFEEVCFEWIKFWGWVGDLIDFEIFCDFELREFIGDPVG